MEYFSVTSDSKLAHRGKKGLITYIHKNGMWRKTKTTDETNAKMLQREWDNDLFYSDNGMVNREMTWEKFKREYLENYPSKRVQTLAKINNTIKYFEKILGLTGKEKVRSILMQRCEFWIKERLKINLPQSVDTERRYMAPMFRKALQYGYIERDPFADIRKIKFVIPEAPSLSVDQALHSLRMIEDREPHRLLLGEFVYETGMRLGELIHQRMEDIDFAGAFVNVRAHEKGCYCYQCGREGREGWDGKAGVPRDIPLSPRLAAKLLSLFQTQKRDCLFQSAPNTIIGVLGRGHERSGIEDKAATHIFRHTLATHMEEAGVQPAFLKYIMGHSKKTTTDGYIHVNRGRLHQEFQKLLDWREAQRTRTQTSTVDGFQVIEAAG